MVTCMAGVLSGRVNVKKLAIVYQPSVLDLELATVGWAGIIFIAPPPLHSPFVSLMFWFFYYFFVFFWKNRGAGASIVLS